MKEITIDGLTVDVSEQCGGVWFDNFELNKLDEAHETAGDKLVEILAPYFKQKIDLSQRLKCPKCLNIVLMRHFYSPKRSIEIDSCPQCGGVWLDPGELAQLRNLFGTEEEKKEHAKNFLREISQSVFEQERAKTDKFVKKTRAVAKALRFICPSYYIPGKQDWGAF